MKEIPKAPQEFEGSMEELFENAAIKVLINEETIYKFHYMLLEYLETEDPMFVIRTLSNLDRGKLIRNQSGFRIYPTDNSPAWWIHYQLFTGQFNTYISMNGFMDDMPSHMFKISIPTHINKAGWYVAHIFDAKDGNTNYNNWNYNELTKRMIKNIHPCNYFYFPKTGETRSNIYGEDQKVREFFYMQYQKKYQTIWKEFIKLIGENDVYSEIDGRSLIIKIPVIDKHLPTPFKFESKVTNPDMEIKCSYNYSRLCFLYNKIEPLALDDKFRITTKNGDFVMTKSEFYTNFPKVVESLSYQRDKKYHFRKVPLKALRFKVS